MSRFQGLPTKPFARARASGSAVRGVYVSQSQDVQARITRGRTTRLRVGLVFPFDQRGELKGLASVLLWKVRPEARRGERCRGRFHGLATETLDCFNASGSAVRGVYVSQSQDVQAGITRGGTTRLRVGLVFFGTWEQPEATLRSAQNPKGTKRGSTNSGSTGIGSGR